MHTMLYYHSLPAIGLMPCQFAEEPPWHIYRGSRNSGGPPAGILDKSAMAKWDTDKIKLSLIIHGRYGSFS
jgi:hypothetical protein